MAVMSLHRKLFFLLLVFLPTQLGYHTWPFWTYVLGRRIDYLSPTLYFTDVIVGVLLVIWCTQSIWKSYKKNDSNLYGKILSNIIYNKRLFFVIPIVILVFVNIHFAINPYIALYGWVKIIEYVFLILYIFRQHVSVSQALLPLSVGVLYSSMIGIAQYGLQHSLGGIFWFLGERTFYIDTPGIARISVCQLFGSSCLLKLRAYSTFSHPNVFGGYLAVIIPLLVHHWNQDHKRMYRLSAGIGSVALMLTFSRSSWVIAMFGIFGIWIWKRMSSVTTFGLIVACVVMLVGGFIYAPVQEESVVVRQQLNVAALEIWKHSPYFGVGVGNFLVALPSSLVSKQVYFLQPVHNIYLLILAEIGLVGVGICLGVLLWLFDMVRLSKNSVHPLVFSIGSLMLLGLVDHYLLTLQQGQLLLVLISALFLSETSVHPKG